MITLEDEFYKVLVDHNHEIVMAGDWLVLVAKELAEVARQDACYCCRENGCQSGCRCFVGDAD